VSTILKRGDRLRAARVAIVFCMAVSSALGTWYLRVRIPENEWLISCGKGTAALEQGRFSEAERHFLAAVEAAHAFGEGDRRLARSQFLLAQALVGQARQTEALRLLERSVAIYTRALGVNHAESARVLEYYTSLRNATAPAEGPEPLPASVP
jgi:tetratricopeptide (TPR) repeat protein